MYIMKIESVIKQEVAAAIKLIYNQDIDEKIVQITKTKQEFEGDFTLVVFPLLKISKKSPDQTASDIGDYLVKNVTEINRFNIIKGFLNIVVSGDYWLSILKSAYVSPHYGYKKKESSEDVTLIEYSSPNTNKPLHLGHIRNNILGWSVAEILKASGEKVVKVNLVNDRGIHICKSMLAWKKWGNEETPEKAKIKGDKLVGNYYVKFDQEYKSQIATLVAEGASEEEATKKAPLIIEAQEMLEKWEAGDSSVRTIWEKMNHWVYKGFDETYKKLGIDFDKTYFESETYSLGKSVVAEGLAKDLLIKKSDGSIWADLTKDGLDEKLLLRANGTSVYMTQDLGTAIQRQKEYHFNKQIYVVGNEQNYHFQVLSLVLKKLGYSWSENLYHLSYGMVELPEGKMKSREGTVVDADELIDEMISTAKEISLELGKLDGYTPDEVKKTCKTIALGALKYFILKVDPKKNMLFNPKESIDFNGNTGPFIQYTYARSKSILRKANEQKLQYSKEIPSKIKLSSKETEIIKLIYEFEAVIDQAAKEYSPALIANYVYELAKEYNQFYHDFPILKETNSEVQNIRLILTDVAGEVIKSAMALLGISVPERM